MHASLTIPALFSVPSTLMIGLGLGNIFWGIAHRSAVQMSTKFSVAPLSTSVLTVAVPRECSNCTDIFNDRL
jgi:hypothetical protein